MALTAELLQQIDASIGRRITVADSSGLDGTVDLEGTVVKVDVTPKGDRLIHYRVGDGGMQIFGFATDYASGYRNSINLSVSAPYVGMCRIYL